MIRIKTISLFLSLLILSVSAFGLSKKALAKPHEVVLSDTSADTFKQILFEIEKSFGVFFNYDDDLLKDLDIDEQLELPKEKAQLNQFLEKLLEPHKLTFEKLNESTYIILKKADVPTKQKEDQKAKQFDQLNRNGIQSVKNSKISTGPRTITGKVTDDNGEGLPGATIIVKDAGDGSITNVDGTFKLDIEEGTLPAILIVSFVGYKSKEVLVTDQTQVNVTLETDISALEEVVVVGYGQQKRSNLTGSVSSVKVENLENRPVIRLDQALQGMSSGVFVSKGGGAPGASPTIHIRGVGSINNTDPLWIIDGVRMAPGNHFNLDDVESIEILKDAASSAIYGAAAAHGVILVTTKRGKEGKTQISYKSSFAKVNPIRLPTLLGSEDFVNYKKQSRINAGQNPEPSWDDWEHDTDWIDAFYDGSGFSHYHDFSVAKGTESSNYYLSFGYDDEEGILIENNFERFSMRFNSDLDLAKWITIGERVLLSRVSENPIDNFNEDYNGAIPYRSIPIMPIYDETNPYGGWGMAPAYFQGPNPVASQYQQHEKRVYNRLDGSVYLAIKPLDVLTIRGQVGYNYLSFLGKSFKEAFNYGAFADPIGRLTYVDGNDETIIGNVVATYDQTFGKHNIKVMGGYEAQKYEGNGFPVMASGSPLDVAWSFNVMGPNATISDRYTLRQSRILSQFGRINYNFDDRYLLEANVRRDASSPQFGPNNVWGIFPSYSLGWRVSNESFFNSIAFISNLKVRVSTGKLGSDKIPGYIWSKTYSSQFSTYAFDLNGTNKVPGYFISKFPNGDVKWEEVNMHNIGLDVGLLEDRLSVTADYYIKDTKDLLYPVPVPSSVGLAVHNFNPVNPELNVGTMRNTGLDLEITYRDNYGKVGLTLNTNASLMKNEVLQLFGDEYITAGAGGGQIGGMTRTEAGMPVSSFYGFVVQQMLNSETDVYAINSWAPDGTYQEGGTGAGDFMYKDISGPEGVPDGQVTWEHDRTFIGNPWPKVMYGFNINMSYNQTFDLLLQFQGLQGVDVFNANKAYSRNFFGDSNTSTDIFEAWTPENHTQHPRNIASDPNGNFSRPSTYFVEDGSYLKLRNAQIGFNMPENILSKLKVGKIRLYVNANNLLTISKYSGMDPEIAGSNVGRGIDYGLYPHTRTFGGGLEVQF
ncbi:SusC/RagA family TonB-linked outer membrane protein [Marinoscillum pacificum]|uniref:SusC/RagA family TonB-linked outer membrane protein n=1 Tax=Marinoscillum pacificum TaxID=392723 RepID=UPI002157C858|nr:TonB-dependent receptor [Marinoscillum pacificum]